MKRMLIATWCAALAVSSMAATKASVTAPVENPPQFIVLGSDDNTDAEALNWMVGILKKYTNKDGSPLRMSFYSNTSKWDKDEALKTAHTSAYGHGHEVSNHTESHPYAVSAGKRMSPEELRAEIMNAQKALIGAGIPREHQFGFRTPYLAYSDSVFTELVAAGHLYDCSVNGGNKWGMTAGNYYWPYTLDFNDLAYEPNESTTNPNDETQIWLSADNYAPDNMGKYNYWNQSWGGAPGPNPIREHFGLWELPCYALVPDAQDIEHMDTAFSYEHGGRVTGLDYNMWAHAKFNKEQSLRTLTNTLDLLLAGNRTPMTFGVHSQYYTDEDASEVTYPNMYTVADRQWFFEEFVKHAVTLENVWFVSGDMVIRWMETPVSADAFNPENYAEIPRTIVEPTENVAPTNITLSNASVNTEADAAICAGTAAIGTLGTVDANTNDTHTYTITDIVPTVIGYVPTFKIEGNSLFFASAVTDAGRYPVIVKTTDKGGLSTEKEFTITVTAPSELGEYFEMVGYEYLTWSTFFDDFGTGSNATAEMVDGILKTSLTKAVKEEQAEDEVQRWPYAGMGGYLDSTGFAKVTAIEIVYTADNDFTMSFTPYSDTLPAGTNVKQVLRLEDFALPSWQQGDAGIPVLSFADYSGPTFNALVDGLTNLSVSSVKLYGYDPDYSPIASGSATTAGKVALSLNGIVSGRMQLSVPTAGAYTVSVYSVDGRMLAQTKTNLMQGMNTLPIAQGLANSLVIVRIKGLQSQLVQKIMIR